MARISYYVCWILLSGFLLLSFSCKSSLKSTEDLRTYIADPVHGLYKVEQIRDIQVCLTYLPAELMDLNETQTKDKYFFMLSFSKNGKELLSQIEYPAYSEMIQVFSFRMPAYLSISTGAAEPVQPDDCLFQPTYGIAKESSLLLVFNKEKLKQAKSLKLQINEFGLGLGNLCFILDLDDINSIPKLSI